MLMTMFGAEIGVNSTINTSYPSPTSSLGDTADDNEAMNYTLGPLGVSTVCGWCVIIIFIYRKCLISTMYNSEI